MFETQNRPIVIDSSYKDDVSFAVSCNSNERNETGAGNTAHHLLQNDPKVRRIRKIAIFVLLVATIGVSGGVYTSLMRSEEREFQNRFEDQAKQIGHALEAELDNKLRAIDALSVTITSFAGSQAGQHWPNVTVPEFSYRAASALSMGRALSVAVYPVVSKGQMSQWEHFSVQHQPWVKEVVEFQEKFPEAFSSRADNADSDIEVAMDHTEEVSAHNISEAIFHFNDGMPIRISDDEMMLPLWQHAPVHPGLPRTNYDAYTVERNRDALDKVIQDQTSVLGQFYELDESCYG
ncbi:MAG: hypothetical protein SGBAC_010250 [Bacillariaceae sp.]